MAANRFEEAIRIIAQTEGGPEVAALVRQIVELEGASGKTAEELSALLDQALDSATLQRSVQDFRELGQETLAASRSFQEAKKRTEQLAQSLEQAYADREAAAKRAADKEQIASKFAEEALRAAQKNVRDLERAYKGAQSETSKLATELDKKTRRVRESSAALKAAGVDTTRLGTAERQLATQATAAADGIRRVADESARTKSEQAQLAQRVKDGDEAFRRQAQANRTSAEALKDYRARAAGAKTETKDLSDQAERSAGIVGKLRGVFAGLLGFLSLRTALEGIKNMLGLGDAAEKTRIQLEALYGSQAAGNAAFGQLEELARRNGLQFQYMLDLATQLKTFGLEPLDGTLQSLIDKNAQMGGSQERLNGIVLALGQAWSKQKLQGEEILQLVERGVPVWDLLAKSTGKSVQELQKLSEKGELGRKVIKGLIDEIGRSADGAAQKNLGLLSNLIQQVIDRGQRWYRQISDAGALEFFKQQLRGVLDAVDQLARDGRLQQYATDVSDAIVATGRAVVGVAKFVHEYSGALLSVAKAYVAVKAAQGGLALVALARNWSMVAAQTIAASGAAAGATTTFGALGAAIRRIPTAIKIGLVVLGYEVIEAVGLKIAEIAAANSDAVQESERAREAMNRRWQDEINQLRLAQRETIGYRDTQVQTAEEVAKLSADELRAYEERLEGAKRFAEQQHAIALREREIRGATQETDAAVAAAAARVTELRVAFDRVAEGVRIANTTISTGLTAAAQAVVKKIGEIVDKAKTAKDTLKGLFDGVNFGSVTQIDAVVDALVHVADTSDDAGRRIQSGLAEQLRQLDGTQLRQFQAAVQSRFDEAGERSDHLAHILDSTLQEAFSRLGVSANVAGAEITEAGQKVIDAFAGIAESGRSSAAQIKAAFEGALNSAKTKAEVEALQVILRSAFEQGRIGAGAFTVAQQAAIDKTLQLKAEVLGVGGAFGQSAADSRKAAQEMIAAMEVARSEIAGKADAIARKLAAAMRPTAEGDPSGDPTVIAQLKRDLLDAEAQIESFSKNIDSAKGKLKEAGTTGSEEFQRVSKSADRAGESAEAVGDKAEQGAAQSKSAVGAVIDLLQQMNQKFGAISENARLLFVSMQRATTEAAISIADVVEGIYRAEAAVDSALEAQRRSAAGMTAAYEELALHGDKAVATARNLGEVGEEAMLNFARAVREGQTSINLLNQADLDRLAAAAEKAAAKVAEIKRQAAAAVDELRRMNDAMQDEADRRAGNEEAILTRQHQKRLEEIEELARRGGEAAAAEAAEARRLAEQAYNEEMERIRQRREAERKASAERKEEIQSENDVRAGGGASASSSDRGSAESGGAGAGGLPRDVRRIELSLPEGPQVTDLYGSDATGDQVEVLLHELTRRLAAGRAISTFPRR